MRAQKPLNITQEMKLKFKNYISMIPWWPPEIRLWRGRWLVHMVSPPACQLLAEGYKPVENIPIKDWVSWGCQGCIVTGIYQGAKALESMENYVPSAFRMAPRNKRDKGKILAMLILGPVDSPSQANDAGWFHPTSPCIVMLPCTASSADGNCRDHTNLSRSIPWVVGLC